MKALIASLAVLLVAGCSTLQKEAEEEQDPRGYVMDHQSAVDRGGVGNYLFRNDYGNKFREEGDDRTAMTEEEEYWTTTQASPTWQPNAELVDGNIEISDEIRFKTGSAELTDNSKRILDDVAEVIKNNEDSIRSVEVAGHTDFTGSRHRNQVLSEQRAESVRRYLTEKGIPEDKLVAEGYGNQRPKYDPQTSSPEELSQNRRVEFRAEPATAVAE